MKSPAQCVQALIAAMLEPAQAGGMTPERASAIFDEISNSISHLDDAAWHHLLGDVIDKWAPAAERVLRSTSPN